MIQKSIDALYAQYIRNFSDYTLAEVGPGLPPVRVLHLRKPGYGVAEGVDLMFASAPASDRIVITGDLAPNDNRGCVSPSHYGIDWFLKASPVALCAKFLEEAWVPDLALDALQSLLKDAQMDTEADAEATHERTLERAFKRLARIEAAVAESEKDPAGECAVTRSEEAFHEWYAKTFDDSPESAGYGYAPRDVALLCAIRTTFLRLYTAMQEKAAKDSEEVWCYADSPHAEQWDGAYATREEAIDAARGECQPDDPLNVHRGRSPDPAKFVPPAEWIARRMRECARDEHDAELVGDWPALKPEAIDELDAILHAWARKHARCTFWEFEGDAESVEPKQAETIDGVVPFVQMGPVGAEGPRST